MNRRANRFGIPDGLLHGVFGTAIEREPVDYGSDDDALLHELLDGLDDVVIVTAQPIHYRRTGDEDL